MNEKIEIAKQLSRLGVDVLEAGFPVASQGDFDAVQRIANEVGPLMVGREAIGKPIVSLFCLSLCFLLKSQEGRV